MVRLRRRNLLSIGILSLVVLASQLDAGEILRAGAAMRVITPDPLLPITGGMGPTSEARGKRGELTVRALVLASGANRLAIVSVDSLGFPSVLGDRARAMIKQVPPDHVLIGATHTHSAPDTYAFPTETGGHTGNLEYMDDVCEKIAEAVNEATEKLSPAEMRVATGSAEGKIAYNFYAPDLYDRRVSVLQFRSWEGKMIATLVNYAVHPEVLGANVGLVSPDLIGPMNDRIEREVGGISLFMNGALGGMITADNRDLDRPSDAQRGYWHDARTWDECLRIGQLLADESMRIVNQESSWVAEPDVSIDVRQVTFPVESDDVWNVVLHSPLKYPHGADRTISTRLAYVVVGSAHLATIPGEALPNIGYYLKRKMPGKHNLLFGLTNDAFGYILTEVDFNSFPRYDYVSRVSLGEKTGTILIRNLLEMAKQHTP